MKKTWGESLQNLLTMKSLITWYVNLLYGYLVISKLPVPWDLTVLWIGINSTLFGLKVHDYVKNGGKDG